MQMKMALNPRIRRFFPLKSFEDVLALFKSQLENNSGPDLALLSILLGYIENVMTTPRTGEQESANVSTAINTQLPEIALEPVQTLYNKFVSLVKNAMAGTKVGQRLDRELLKQISDAIWSSLSPSYFQDRPHLQSLYSYLTGNKLDCFGVAYAVVAACQVLNYDNVHLVLSEDHAWVQFRGSANNWETAEVTWHGKGIEDRRGLPIPENDRSWIYLNGEAVVCSKAVAVAAVVLAMNPYMTPTMDSIGMIILQQQLLWLLYDLGALSSYPVALGILGELESISDTPGRPPPLQIFQTAIGISRAKYNDMHVYPYTYLGGYAYRMGAWRDALEAWASAANVIRNYNYTKDDEEIYKEFLEIANELVPSVVRCSEATLGDPSCFASLLRLYDGLCSWEEGSTTPVLHIGWAKPLVWTISKFPHCVRSQVRVRTAAEEEETGKLEDIKKDAESNNNNNNDEVESSKSDASSTSSSLSADVRVSKIRNGVRSASAATKPEVLMTSSVKPEVLMTSSPEEAAEPNSSSITDPQVILLSHKMAGLKDLLLAEKLNTSAISLQLTAQSQVAKGKKNALNGDENGVNGSSSSSDTVVGQRRPKRIKRE